MEKSKETIRSSYSTWTRGKWCCHKQEFDADKIDHQFITPVKVSQLKQKHSWIEKKPAGHKTLQATFIIFHEVQTTETQRHTNNLQQNSKGE